MQSADDEAKISISVEEREEERKKHMTVQIEPGVMCACLLGE